MDQNMNERHVKVCVTGASGFLASWLVKRLLSSGYFVIATVRDPGNEKKVAHLKNLDGAQERLCIVQAELMEDGSFDKAIMGCQCVFHTASPLLMKPDMDPQVEMVKTAVEGTLNVLRSCKKNPSLKRVIMTSSTTAARNREGLDPNVSVDESCWTSEEFCHKREIWYALSKVLAEKAAWEFCETNNIDLVTVLPSFAVGPSLPPLLSITAFAVVGLLKGEAERLKMFSRVGYVHIDDVALCHILLFENENARGRYLCNAKVLDIGELVSILAARFPTLPIAKRIDKFDASNYDYNSSKVKNMGMKFKSIEEMFDDCVASLVEQGHLALV